jgi:hypothetical protein
MYLDEIKVIVSGFAKELRRPDGSRPPQSKGWQAIGRGADR